MEYKVKTFLDNYASGIEISSDLQENIELIKTLSDDFTVEDEQAIELDGLTRVELEKLYEAKNKQDIQQYDDAKEVERDQETIEN